MKTTIRIIIQICTLLLIKLPLQLLGIIIVPIELLFHLKDTRTINCLDQRLFFKWFDNGDELDRKYGLNGDIGYQNSKGNPKTPFKLYLSRLTWLAFRNPVNYFQYNILGVKVKYLGEVILHDNYIQRLKQDNAFLEVSDWSEAGKRKVETSTGFWEYYIVYKYPFNHKKCFRARIGHKLGHFPLIQPRSTVQWVCAIQPWKDYRGN